METPKDNSGGSKPTGSGGSGTGGSSDGGGRSQGGEYGRGTNWRLSEADKLEAAVVALEGDTLLWFQWEHTRRPVTRWKEMKSLLLRQFRPTNASTLHQQWLALTQTGSILEYQRAFIERLAPLSNIPEDITLGQFLNGLNGEIRSEVQLLSPMSVENVMTMAIKVEQKLQSQLKRKPHPSPVTQRTNTTGSISGTPLITPIKTTIYSSKSIAPPPIYTPASQTVNNRVSGEVRSAPTIAVHLSEKEAQKDSHFCGDQKYPRWQYQVGGTAGVNWEIRQTLCYDASNSLWSNTNDNEDDLTYVFNETTPAMSFEDLAYQDNGNLYH
ncbi:unnamed protein product [Lactuca virosa]|uniref:Retrotransposon gag domain-containing protein n=1 Tax=Lactuca virosa TaxID=75947 RepID=A0AAU9N1I4_9ASTR|nr:unnamed protein product [Lactuca virosa]